MAHNGDEEFIIILSDSESDDDSGDEGELLNIPAPEVPMQVNANEVNQMNVAPPMAPAHENNDQSYVELLFSQMPPLTPKPSFSFGHSSSESDSEGTITISDSAPIEPHYINGFLPPELLDFWGTNNVSMLNSGIDAHITLCTRDSFQDLRETMAETMKECGIQVISNHVTIDGIKTMYFFLVQVTIQAFQIPFGQSRTPHSILVEALKKFLSKYPEYFQF